MKIPQSHHLGKRISRADYESWRRDVISGNCSRRMKGGATREVPAKLPPVYAYELIARDGTFEGVVWDKDHWNFDIKSHPGCKLRKIPHPRPGVMEIPSEFAAEYLKYHIETHPSDER